LNPSSSRFLLTLIEKQLHGLEDAELMRPRGEKCTLPGRSSGVKCARIANVAAPIPANT
jgi:hypothetical protein